MFETIINWFRTYEFIAIWLEGIALGAIFIWDRVDSGGQETHAIAQLKASQDQVEAAQKPCLAFSTAPRGAEEAILEIGGAIGTMNLQNSLFGAPRGRGERQTRFLRRFHLVLGSLQLCDCMCFLSTAIDPVPNEDCSQRDPFQPNRDKLIGPEPIDDCFEHSGECCRGTFLSQL